MGNYELPIVEDKLWEAEKFSDNIIGSHKNWVSALRYFSEKMKGGEEK